VIFTFLYSLEYKEEDILVSFRTGFSSSAPTIGSGVIFAKVAKQDWPPKITTLEVHRRGSGPPQYTSSDAISEGQSCFATLTNITMANGAHGGFRIGKKIEKYQVLFSSPFSGGR
jgi:hypothetical protein